ncbi:hypothetical protein EON65_04290 [archaeon]|nr:MAG: hypothetical protein EON65_04290 [archaeon]
MGQRRIIRAHELHDWVVKNTTYTAHTTKPPLDAATFFHCLRNHDSQGHVGFIDVYDKVTDAGSTFEDVQDFYY